MSDDDGRHTGITFSPDGEKPKITIEEVRQLIEAGRLTERERLRARVEALEEHIVERGELWVRRNDVLALIAGSNESP